MRNLLLFLVITVCHTGMASDLQLATKQTIESEELQEIRDIYVRLPKGYDFTSQEYPVIYLLHGQWDLLAAASTINLLDGQIPNFILVAINSSGPELRPQKDQHSSFDNFLLKELKPYIEAQYRVADYSILSGHSNSGRFVLNQWLRTTHSFSTYFAFSPSLDDGFIVEQALKVDNLSDRPPLKVTMANEGEHMSAPFKRLTSLVESDKHRSALFENESHNSTKHPSLKFALTTTFPEWEASYEVKTAGFDTHIKHFNDLSEKFGFKVNAPTNSLVRLTAYYAMQDNDNASAELNKYVKHLSTTKPDGIESLFEIVDYFSNNEMGSTATSLTTVICQQSPAHIKCQ